MGVILSFCVCVHMRRVHERPIMNTREGAWRGDGFPWRRSHGIIAVAHHGKIQFHGWFGDGWEPSCAQVLQQ